MGLQDGGDRTREIYWQNDHFSRPDWDYLVLNQNGINLVFSVLPVILIIHLVFLSTIKMCKIGLQAADYKITSPVLCDIVFWTLFILSGTRIVQNPLQMAEYSAWMLRSWVETPWSETFLSPKMAISHERTPIHQSKIKCHCPCTGTILNINTNTLYCISFSPQSVSWGRKHLVWIVHYTPCFNKVERGVYWFHIVRLSVCLSVRLWTKPFLLCIFHNTSRIHFIFAHLINPIFGKF